MTRGRGMVRGAQAAAAAGVILALVVLANLMVAHHPAHWDVTRGALYTLSPRTRALLAGLDRPVEVLVLEGDPAYGELYRDIDALTAELSQAAGGRITVARVDPVADPRRLGELAQRFGILPDALEQAGAVLVASGRRHHSLGLGDLADFGSDASGGGIVTAFRGEAALASAILDVTSEVRPRLCLTTSHGERSWDGAGGDDDWQRIGARLLQDGDDLVPLSPVKPAEAHCDVVVVAGPRAPFSPDEQNALGAYVDAGGRLLVALEPGTTAGGFAPSGLEAMLERRGVDVTAAIAVDPAEAIGSPRRWRTLNGYGEHPAVRALAGRLVTTYDRPRAVAVVPGAHATALIRTSASGWGETDPAQLAGTAELAQDAGDRPGPVAIAVAAEPPGGGRVIVFGDASAFDSRTLAAAHGYDDQLAESWLAWLTSRDNLIAVGPKLPEQLRLIMTPAALRRIFWLSAVVLPLIWAMVGAIVWRRRRAA